MDDVVEECDVNVPRRQHRIGELPEHRLDARHLRGGGALADLGKKALVDFYRVNPPSRAYGLCKRSLEQSGSGADVGDGLSRLELHGGDDLVDLQRGDARAAVEGFDPFLGGPGGKLPGGWDGRCNYERKANGRAQRNDRDGRNPHRADATTRVALE